jgi:hypothetical protein
MLLVKKTNVNSKSKQDPNPSRYFLYKDSNLQQTADTEKRGSYLPNLKKAHGESK